MSRKNDFKEASAYSLSDARLKRQQRYQSYRKKQKSEERAENVKGTLKRFVVLLKPYWLLVVVVGLAATAGAILNVLGPDVMGEVIDALRDQVEVKLNGGSVEFGGIRDTLVSLFLVYFSGSIMSFIQQYTLAGISQKLVCSLRDDVNKKLSRLPLKYFDTNAKGEVLSKIINDCDNLSNTLQNNITTVISSTVQFFGALIMMLIKSWQMALIVVIIIPFSAAISYGISRVSKRLFRQHWDRLGELNGHVEEMYTGHNIVKIFGREKDSVDEFNDINEELYSVTKKANFISGLVSPLLKFLNNIAYVGYCVYGGYMIINNTLSLGDVQALIQYANMFSSPITNIGNIVNTIQSALASAERVFKLLDEEEEIPDDPKCELLTANGAVEFNDVSFRYIEDKPLIDNMDIRVERGQLAAIVGPTGAGKTTFVNLLMRFYEINGGYIAIDGVDIRDLSRKNLRGLFGMVLQDTWLFKGTIRENIAYGREGASLEDVIEAAKAARVHHFIETLQDGYETMLDEDGTNISQGQRQLVTIARAILADPAILILDEATSSVDTRTELQIQEAMKTLMTNRTNFVIAHRLSTIKTADVILVMRRGSIVEQGTHESLLEAGGFYAALYHSQYTGGIPPEDTE